MKLSSPVVFFLLFGLLTGVISQNCTNPMLNYDIFDDIIFLENSTLLTSSLPMCNLTTGDYTCCSELNANDVGVVYDKFKTRIEDYNTDWILNYKNIFNGYLDLNSMGITTGVPNLETAIKNVILEYRAEIKKINKQQSLCASVPMQMFAGTLCLVCSINYQNYLRILNPEEKNTNLSKYTMVYTKSNCDTIYTNCKDYLELRKNLETRVYTYLVKILDTLTQYIGEMPYENITLISSSFSNSSALNDPLMNTRLLSPTEECEQDAHHSNSEKNDVIVNDIYQDEEEFSEDDLDLDDFSNITTTTSTHNLDFISRGLRSSGGRSSGGRSSGSRSSGRSSSSSRSSSGSSSGRSTGSSSTSGGSAGGRSVYSSRTTYGARTSTASSTVKSGSSARSTFSKRTSTSSAYKSTSYSYTRTSRTYSYSRNSYVVIYNSRYGSLYRGYYYHNRYGSSGEKTVAQTNSSTGVSYKIATYDDYQGVLSPFYSASSLPADIQTQENNYHQKYLDWMGITTNPNTLIENCPKNYKKCRVCVGNSCSYFTKSTSEYYDKYCIMQTVNGNTGFVCNICVDESCDLEANYTPPPQGTSLPLSFKYSNNRFTTDSSSGDYKDSSLLLTVSDEDAIQSFKNNPRYSTRTRRIVPSDVALPDIQLPSYTSPCSDENSCKTWMCSNFFDGILPEASKLANPQVNSRTPMSSFSNTTNQTVTFTYEDAGFDAYAFGAVSKFNSTALIDGVNIWSSDAADPL